MVPRYLILLVWGTKVKRFHFHIAQGEHAMPTFAELQDQLLHLENLETHYEQEISMMETKLKSVRRELKSVGELLSILDMIQRRQDEAAVAEMGAAG